MVTLSRWKLEVEELRAFVNRTPKFLYFGVTAGLFAFSRVSVPCLHDKHVPLEIYICSVKFSIQSHIDKVSKLQRTSVSIRY